MPEILALLQSIAPLFSKTTLRRMSHVIYGMLVASGRITMLGLSRWTEKGGSYRSLQGWYYGALPWNAIHWLLFRLKFLKQDYEYLIAGDEVVASKTGQATYGLDRFFSSIQQRVILGLSFFTFSLVNVREERSYPLRVAQVVKSAEEKASGRPKPKRRRRPHCRRETQAWQAQRQQEQGQAGSGAESRFGAYPDCLEKPAGHHRSHPFAQICRTGWAFWQLPECLHGVGDEPAPDIQNAFGCVSVSSV